MRVTMRRELLDYLREQAIAAYPEECCGLLAGADNGGARAILDTHQLENALGDERDCRYLIADEDYRATERIEEAEGRTVVGVYHSHPNGSTTPGTADVHDAWPWLVYLILGTQPGQVEQAAWVLRNDRAGFDPVELAVE